MQAFNDTIGAFNMSAGSLNGTGTLTAATYSLTGGTVNAKLGAGAVTVNTGTVTLGSAGRFDTSASLVIQGGQLNLAGSETVASFQQTGGTLAGAHTLSSTTAYDMRSGTVSANLGGSVGLNKTTAGTVTLNGTNTYSGLTSISGTGTLALGAAGSINNSSGVALGTAGTFDVSAKSGGYTVDKLSGSGAVIGAITVTTELAIGNSPGLVTYDALTLGAVSTSRFEVTGGGTTGDLGDVNGLLTITSGATLDLVQLGTYTVGDKFTLFAYNSLSGTFAGLTDEATFINAGGLWRIDYNDNGTAGLNLGSVTGTSFVTVTAIPEPNVAALLGCLGALVLLRRRRN
jgi:fibronectin-binding autotransporter adhesin